MRYLHTSDEVTVRRIPLLAITFALAFGVTTARAEPPGHEAAPEPTYADPLADPVADPVAEPLAEPLAEPAQNMRYLWISLEIGAALTVPGIWYWANVDFNRVDWELHWDGPSWRQKLLTFEAVRFDTNSFYTNGVRHPFAGVVNYQIGRANGFGMLGATGVNVIATWLWEYVVEFRELVSLNDMIMNVSAGVSIGEPLLQLGRFGLTVGSGATTRALSSSLTPFDALHGWRSGNGFRDSYWYRLHVAAGLGESLFDADTRRSEVAFDAEMDLVSHPGYARAGVNHGWTAPGAWNRGVVEFRIAAEDSADFDDRVSGIAVRTQTSMLGHYAQQLVADGTGLRGSSRFVGAGAAFSYRRRRIGGEWDRLAIAHIAGPRLELVHYDPRYVLRWELAGYAVFAMVQAHVFGPEPNRAPSVELTSALAAEGYYFARGLSLSSRAGLDAGPWSLELEVRAHQMWSIDGLDRRELDNPDLDPHDIVDQRVFSNVNATLRPGGGPLAIGADLELGLYRGTWSDLERQASELSIITRASWWF